MAQKYEIHGNVGGDKDLSRREKNHLGGFGGSDLGFSFSSLNPVPSLRGIGRGFQNMGTTIKKLPSMRFHKPSLPSLKGFKALKFW